MKQIVLKANFKVGDYVHFDGKNRNITHHNETVRTIVLDNLITLSLDKIAIVDSCTCNPDDDACNACVEELDESLDAGMVDMEFSSNGDITMEIINDPLLVKGVSGIPDGIYSAKNIADAGKSIEECQHVYSSLCRLHKINNCACSAIYFDPVCKKCGRIIKAETQKEEKTALKLRVGGIYKNRKNDSMTIINVDKHTDDSIIYQDNYRYWYRENGRYLTSADNYIWDLIEEVQSELCVKPTLQNSARVKQSDASSYTEPTVSENDCDHDFEVECADEGTSHYGKCKKCPMTANDVAKLKDEKETVDKCEWCKKHCKISEEFCKCQEPSQIYIEQIEEYFCKSCKNKWLFKESYPRSEGNPFKVGDKCRCYGNQAGDRINHIINYNGETPDEVKEVEGDWVGILNKHFKVIHYFHYKQCEKV